MSLPPNAPPPPPPAMAPPPPPPPAYVAAPGPPPASPSHGKASQGRLIGAFVAILVVGIAVGALAVVAFQPAKPKPDCPPPPQPCGGPPVVPTLPVVANATPTVNPTPVITIPPPSGTLVIPSAAASAAPTAAPTASLPPSADPSAAASVEPSATPQVPSAQPPASLAITLPAPQVPSSAAALTNGTVWTSSKYNFRLEYDDQLWKVEDEAENGVVFSAGNGAVVVWIEGFAPNSSTKSLIQAKRKSLGDFVLGLTDETDDARIPPGVPIIGHKPGDADVLNGTLNSPQGPTDNVDVVIMAATDGQVAIRVTVLAVDDVREPAYAVSDRLINTIEWPSDL